jgi:2,3-bisphosphoglycerate-independent phosphoglycerate mutase
VINLKYLVVLTDGMADHPLSELNGKTPLQVSKKPNMDRLAQSGEVGLVRNVPPGMSPGSDVANLAVMGYDPCRYYTGRSPLEAISIGVEMSPTDVSFRCNLVTLTDASAIDERIMADYSAGEITTPESEILIKELAQALNSKEITFYSGISYRHLMVWHNAPSNFRLTPPHDISDRPIGDYLPQGDSSDTLLGLIQKSWSILDNHPVNQARKNSGLHPANSIWFWGEGRKPNIPSFTEKYGLKGSVISAVDLAKGLGIAAGLKVINVPGATGNIHTNFQGKARAVLEAFRSGDDFVYLHIEAPDEAGHQGDLKTKINAIERIDAEVLALILSELPKIATDFRIMLLPDHPTPLTLKTHVGDPVPFVIHQAGQKNRKGSAPIFDEVSAAGTGIMIEEGYQLMDRFIMG